MPVVGARSAAQLDETLRAGDLTLDSDAIASLSEVSAVPLGFPGDFLAWELVRHMVFAGLYDKIVRPVVPR